MAKVWSDVILDADTGSFPSKIDLSSLSNNARSHESVIFFLVAILFRNGKRKEGKGKKWIKKKRHKKIVRRWLSFFSCVNYFFSWLMHSIPKIMNSYHYHERNQYSRTPSLFSAFIEIPCLPLQPSWRRISRYTRAGIANVVVILYISNAVFEKIIIYAIY